jgi:hypothetical protein
MIPALGSGSIIYATAGKVSMVSGLIPEYTLSISVYDVA